MKTMGAELESSVEGGQPRQPVYKNSDRKRNKLFWNKIRPKFEMFKNRDGQLNKKN